MRTVVETPTFRKQADNMWSEDERYAKNERANVKPGDIKQS